MAKFFAIQHKSGDYLPAYRGRGYTWTEPGDSPVPRLFPTIGAAKNCLHYYLQGPLVRDFSEDWETGIREEDGVKNPPNYIPRNPDDYTIVTLELLPCN